MCLIHILKLDLFLMKLEDKTLENLLTGELNIPDFDEPEEAIDPLGTIPTPPLNTVPISTAT